MQNYVPHLIELRSRLLKTLVFFSLALVFSYYFRLPLYRLIVRPLASSENLILHQVIYTNLTEAFTSYLRLSVFAAVWISFPIASYQIYRFLAPGLYRRERWILRLVLGGAPLLFWAGSTFMFLFVIPKAWQFFLSFQHSEAGLPLILQVKMNEYVELTIQMTLAFGLAFQMPIILLVLMLIGVVKPEQLIRGRRFAIVINFVLGAILTPPDVVSQIALAIPLVLLYEMTIIVGKLLVKKA